MGRRSQKKAGPGKAPIVRSSASVSLTAETLGGTSSHPLEAHSRPSGWAERWAILGVCIFLVAIIWLVFGQTLGFGFVNFDDNKYVYQNPIVQKGLTWDMHFMQTFLQRF